MLKTRSDLAKLDVSDSERKEKERILFSDYSSEENFCDGLLNDRGIEQATQQQDLINQFEYVKVLVSPLRRTI